MTLKMEMDARKVELLIRSALLEDAKTVNQRLGAVLADINVLDDEEVWITLDDDLWEDSEKTPAVDALAEMLMMEIEWNATVGTFPFAWPGLGEFTNSTPEYFKMVLDAYGSQKPKGE